MLGLGTGPSAALEVPVGVVICSHVNATTHNSLLSSTGIIISKTLPSCAYCLPLEIGFSSYLRWICFLCLTSLQIHRDTLDRLLEFTLEKVIGLPVSVLPKNVFEMYSDTWFPDLLISERCVSSRFSILLNCV